MQEPIILYGFLESRATIEEVKADRQPVGKYEFEKPFTTHKRIINKGDKIYLFLTDTKANLVEKKVKN